MLKLIYDDESWNYGFRRPRGPDCSIPSIGKDTTKLKVRGFLLISASQSDLSIGGGLEQTSQGTSFYQPNSSDINNTEPFFLASNTTAQHLENVYDNLKCF